MADYRTKILIADDDPDIRDTLAAILSDYPVLTAPDGVQALRVAEAERPALLLLDVNMPGAGGLQVLERSAALSPRPMVIMITAETDIETGAKAVSLGSYAYLTKPLDADRVRETARAALAEFARRNP